MQVAPADVIANSKRDSQETNPFQSILFFFVPSNLVPGHFHHAEGLAHPGSQTKLLSHPHPDRYMSCIFIERRV